MTVKLFLKSSTCTDIVIEEEGGNQKFEACPGGRVVCILASLQEIAILITNNLLFKLNISFSWVFVVNGDRNTTLIWF